MFKGQSLFLLGALSTWYITKMPISPYYIAAFIGIFSAGLSFVYGQRIYKSPSLIIAIIFLAYLIIVQIWLSPNVSTFVGLLLSLLTFILLVAIKADLSESVRCLKGLIYLTLPVVIYEAYYRITNPIINDEIILREREDLLFQFYKSNSIMYPDSNFVGLMLVSIFGLALYLKKCRLGIHWSIPSIYFMLIFLTLSRASIVSALICLLLYLFFNQLKKQLYFLVFTISIFLIFIFLSFDTLIVGASNFDDSLFSKFALVVKSVYWMREGDFDQLIFGVGLGNAELALGMGAHNIVLVYVIESGFIGLALFAALWLSIVLRCDRKFIIVWLPFLINAMSVSTTAMAYIYVISAMCIHIASGYKAERAYGR